VRETRELDAQDECALDELIDVEPGRVDLEPSLLFVDPAIRAEEEKAKLLLANSIDDCQQLSWRRCAAAGSDRVCGSEPMTTAGPRGRAQRRMCRAGRLSALPRTARSSCRPNLRWSLWSDRRLIVRGIDSRPSRSLSRSLLLRCTKREIAASRGRASASRILGLSRWAVSMSV
jgi:hypothetical protein